ncbi:MAG: hypothetical protein EOM54_06310 [Clostridia bacterium]|nr:hypothetical protein [Clostridia bacterium]
MRKNSLVICCVTCVFGAFGAFFRWLQDLTGFEEDTGLYISGNIWSRALIVACVGAALALFVMVLDLKKKKLSLPEEYSAAMGGTTVLYRPAYIGLASLMAAGSIILIFSAFKDAYPVLQVSLSLMGLLAAAGFTLMTSATRRRRDPPLNCFGATLIIALFCFWLIVSYRENAVGPVVWSYAIEILALACTLVAFYYIASVPFGRPKPFSAIFFSQFGAFLCIVALPDDRWTGQKIMLAAAAGMLLFLSYALIANLRPREN